MKSWMYTAALLVLLSIPAVRMAGADGQTEAAKPAAAGLGAHVEIPAGRRHVAPSRADAQFVKLPFRTVCLPQP